MSNEQNPDQTLAACQETSEEVSLDFSTAKPLVTAPVADPEYRYWIRWKIPTVLFHKFVNSETDPITGDGGDGPLLRAIEEYEAAKLAKGKIPPRSDVAPPLPKAFDFSRSVPPTIADGQYAPSLRVHCPVCRSTFKNVHPVAHSCAEEIEKEISHGI